MSQMVVCRDPNAVPAGLRLTPVDPEAFDFGVERAVVETLRSGTVEEWHRVEPVDCHWDDLLGAASGFGPPKKGTRFEALLLALARSCSEVAIFYPGDEHSDFPVVDEPAEFASSVTAMVGRGNIEPKLRFVRPPR